MRFLRAIEANMRDALGNSEIKTFVTQDFFLSIDRVISQSGTGEPAIIAATMHAAIFCFPKEVV